MNKHLLYALRPRQWIKSGFVLLPLIFSGRFTDGDSVIRALAATLIYSFISSCAYLYNDIKDIAHDRKHPTKKLRPLAAGKISLGSARALLVGLFLVSVGAAFWLNVWFGAIILTYSAGNIVYSKWLKHVVLIDVMCIAFFFLLRVIAGCVVISAVASPWIVICTFLLALFLGFIKRRQELLLLKRKAYAYRRALADYDIAFLDQLIVIVATSTIASYTLYTVSSQTVHLIGSLDFLFTVPFVYYGIFRYLYLVHKKGKGGEPERIVFSDSSLLIDMLCWAVVAMVIVMTKPHILPLM